MRPDHGHQMLDDLKEAVPRLWRHWPTERLGGIEGLELGIERSI